MNKHTVTLETAEKLKELGFEKETYFKWGWMEDSYYELIIGDTAKEWHKPLPAPIASELLEELPDILGDGSELFIDKYSKDVDRYGVFYRPIDPRKHNQKTHIATDKTKLPAYSLAESLALMWIYLKENKLI